MANRGSWLLCSIQKLKKWRFVLGKVQLRCQMAILLLTAVRMTDWLLPYVEPSYKVTIKDDDYPEKKGDYYVIATEVEFSSSGGVRKVMLGRKI